MRNAIVLVLAAVVLPGCDSSGGGPGADHSASLGGKWALSNHPDHPPAFDIDAQVWEYRFTYWTQWSVHEQCTTDSSGPVTSTTDPGIVLGGLHTIPFTAGIVSDTLSYDVVKDELLLSSWPADSPDNVSRIAYVRAEAAEFDTVYPYCTDLDDRFSGTWTLTALADSTGSVLADWQAKYPSFVIRVDETGNGTADIEAAAGTIYSLAVDFLFFYEDDLEELYLVGEGPFFSGEFGFIIENGTGEMNLTFYFSPNNWNRAFDAALDGSSQFTFVRN